MGKNDIFYVEVIGMKKLIVAILTFMLVVIPIEVNAKDKVKVYMFFAGGCPYCAYEEEYLTGLSSYNKKFELIKKELFEDHSTWIPGSDFILGVKVASAYNKIGFTSASYNGTPLVVISDLYAANAYSTELESVIDEAYEKGDKDIVACISKGKDGCVEGYVDAEETTKAEDAKEAWIEMLERQKEQQESGYGETQELRKVDSSLDGTKALIILGVFAGVVIIFVGGYTIVSKKNNKKKKK